MTITTIITDGQITIPKEMLHALNIQTGDTVDVESLPDGSIRIFPKTLNASEMAGMLKTNVHSTIEEMDETVTATFRKSS